MSIAQAFSTLSGLGRLSPSCRRKYAYNDEFVRVVWLWFESEDADNAGTYQKRRPRSRHINHNRQTRLPEENYSKSRAD